MPTEVHEHFDTEGNPTGTTVITRESEWDDSTRNRVLELDAYEALKCPCGCGLLITESQKEQPFLVDSVMCHASRAMAEKRRRDEAEAKSKNKPEDWNDGLMYFVRLPEKRDQRGGA